MILFHVAGAVATIGWLFCAAVALARGSGRFLLLVHLVIALSLSALVIHRAAEMIAA